MDIWGLAPVMRDPQERRACRFGRAGHHVIRRLLGRSGANSAAGREV
jgi:hypothetical protein